MGGGTLQSALRSYVYDPVNRLSSYNEPNKNQAYDYDAFGNIWQTSPANSNIGSLRAQGPSAYELPGNQVTNRLAGTAYDLSGNQTQLSVLAGTNATYDLENRLVRVDLNGATIASYDGVEVRIENGLIQLRLPI